MIRNILPVFVLAILNGCSPDNSEIRIRALDKLSLDESINYDYNQLTIQGSPHGDTTFIETFSSSSFLRMPEDRFIGYNYVIQDSLIHPYFNVPVKTVYHYNGTKLTTALISPAANSIKEENTSETNKAMFNNVMKGQLPTILFILQSQDSQMLRDSLVNDELCIQLSVIKDKLRHSLFISKETYNPVMLRIITNTFQPYIEEYYYKNFTSSSTLNVPDYKSEVDSNSDREQPPLYRIGDTLPNLELLDLSGNNITIGSSSNFKIIYISMINCGPCQRAIPYVEKIYESYKSTDNVDFFVFYPLDPKDKLQKYATTKKINTPIIYNSIFDEQKRLEITFGLNMGFPSVLFLDKENRIQQIIHSFSTNLDERIKAKLETMMGGQN